MSIKLLTIPNFIGFIKYAGLSFLFILVFINAVSAQDNIAYSPSVNDSVFTEYLITNKLYIEAIYLCKKKIIHNDSKEKEIYNAKLGRIYFLKEDYDSSLFYLHSSKAFNDAKISMMMDADEIIVKKDISNIDSNGEINNLSHTLLLLSYYLSSHQLERFDSTLSVTDNFYFQNIYIDNLYRIRRDENNNNKSAVLAAAMSAIIPGSGKIYAGNYKQGLSALLVEILLGGQDVEIWNMGMWTNPLLYPYSALLVIFHSGNIYGSYAAVKLNRINHRKEIDNKVFSNIHNYIISLE
jgi:hypothetical protein